jgi:hypothetical protein
MRRGDLPLSDLRPMGPGAVLDSGFVLLRRRFGQVMALTACLYVPIWLVSVVIAVLWPPDLVATGSSSGFGWSGLTASTSSSLQYVVLVAQLAALSLLGLCIGWMAMELARGSDPTLRDLRSVALRRWWVAVLIVPMTVAVHTMAACAGGIGWILGDAIVFIASVSAGAECVGPWRALVRSWQLTRPQYGRALVLSLGSLAISQIIRWSLSVGPTTLVLSLDPSSRLIGLVGALSSAVLLVSEPLTACIAAVAYLDLRCRREGLDLSLRHQRLVEDHQLRRPMDGALG